MIDKCPCCDWKGYKDLPLTSDEAILACEWCTTNMLGEPHLCSAAKDAAQRLKDATRNDDDFTVCALCLADERDCTCRM